MPEGRSMTVSEKVQAIWRAMVNAVDEETEYKGYMIMASTRIKEDIGADSLAFVQMLLDIEEELGASFGTSEDDLMSCETIGELAVKLYEIIKDD